MRLLLIITAAGCAAAAALVAAPSRTRSHPSSFRMTPRLRDLSQQLAHRGRRTPAQMRKDVAELLRQFSALLVSGRGEGQAWSDLRQTWRSRDPDHPLAQVSAHIAASEASGTGTAEGLRRYVAANAGTDPELNRLLNRLVAVTALSEQTGAPLSSLVEQLADSVDESAELAAAVETATAGPKLTQMILSLLPLGGLALGQIMGADPLATLLGSTIGLACMCAGLGFLVAGRFWSHRMIRVVTRHG
ncbi:hypothetical protein FEF26_00115 [Nesterenkonia salmonea]|uniref:Type II secretion system protein GspF domain-containing protein n=1 Tax=Nesterenkonia salmonea TaxID=1804987 RepID=A0A5R9BL27_9MICC|nr:type II secretion system F family protein [Nesterenkonia salmonea]TLQ01428.1 hypothetical protein FEF26_00115 [Nesterenkonia salmonea]